MPSHHLWPFLSCKPFNGNIKYIICILSVRLRMYKMMSKLLWLRSEIISCQTSLMQKWKNSRKGNSLEHSKSCVPLRDKWSVKLHVLNFAEQSMSWSSLDIYCTLPNDDLWYRTVILIKISWEMVKIKGCIFGTLTTDHLIGVDCLIQVWL